jgi:RNA polymerase sigma factor (sigma-70 family)
MPESFRDSFVKLFEAQFSRLFRYVNRLSGDPELAADVAQEAFVRLYRRGSLPEAPEAWLITVCMNLFRNAKSTRARRRRLLTIGRAEAAMSDPPAVPGESEITTGSSERARAALDRMSQRDRHMLLLRAEGYSYHDIAIALELNEGSVGTLLARAKRAFREAYEANPGAS